MDISQNWLMFLSPMVTASTTGFRRCPWQSGHSTPDIKLPISSFIHSLLYGTNGEKIEMHRTNEFGSGVYYNTFEGIVENLERRFRETSSEWMKEEIGSFMSGVECPDCHGKRLKPVVLAVTVGDKNISEFCEMSIRDELKFIAENEPNLTEKQRQIGGQIMKEIRKRRSRFSTMPSNVL